jgi:hypothetical protein
MQPFEQGFAVFCYLCGLSKKNELTFMLATPWSARFRRCFLSRDIIAAFRHLFVISISLNVWLVLQKRFLGQIYYNILV